MESSIFVLNPIKGVFWPFKVERRIYLTDTVYSMNSFYFISVLKVSAIKFQKLMFVTKRFTPGDGEQLGEEGSFTITPEF